MTFPVRDAKTYLRNELSAYYHERAQYEMARAGDERDAIAARMARRSERWSGEEYLPAAGDDEGQTLLAHLEWLALWQGGEALRRSWRSFLLSPRPELEGHSWDEAFWSRYLAPTASEPPALSGDPLWGTLEGLSSQTVDLCAQQRTRLERFERIPWSDASPARAQRLELAQQVLQQSADEAAEARARFFGTPGDPHFHRWLRAHLQLPAHALPREVWRTLFGHSLPKAWMDFLSRRLHLQSATRPRALPRLVATRPPQRLHLQGARRYASLLGWSLAIDAFGQATALALSDPASSIVYRQPLFGTLARTLGALLRLLWSTPHFLRRELQLSAQESTRVAEGFRALYLSRLRLSARLVELDAGPIAFPRWRESLIESESLELPQAALAWAQWQAPLVGGGLRAEIAALQLHEGLRDLFDEDWYRNPRSAPALRACFEAGAKLSAEAALRELVGSRTSAVSSAKEAAHPGSVSG